MLGLGIRYLNGFVSASQPDQRECVEWPPHPARVFMALAAAHFETGEDPREREVLEWLEVLPAPAIRAADAAAREVVVQYVPVNDKPGDKSKPPTAILQSAPELARSRQPRTFAQAWLEDDTVLLVWPQAEPTPLQRSVLEGLCRKVTRIGHSTSLVQMWATPPAEVVEPNWVPDGARAKRLIRVTDKGTLRDLERCFNRDRVEAFANLKVAAENESAPKEKKAARKQLKARFGDQPPLRLRPVVSLFQGYARPVPPTSRPPVPGTLFSPHLLVFCLERREGPYRELDLACTLALTRRWREALLSRSEEVPEVVRGLVSGHDPGGAPLNRPHVAFLSLPFVGHRYADGHLLGLGTALPEHIKPAQRRGILRVLSRVNELKLGRLGVWALRRNASERPPWNLRDDTWTAHPAGSRTWSTVTPLAFDRHPKARNRARRERQSSDLVAAMAEAIGLPRPQVVITTPACAHLGVPAAHDFPALSRKDGSARRHVHATLVFDEPVRGPVLLGAGRYRGYGLCRPLDGAVP